jgi:hypothetical protein
VNTLFKKTRRFWDSNAEKYQFIDFVVVPLALLVFLLIGNYGVFFGQTFFTASDPAIVFHNQAQNSHSLGWRSDVGLGISYFFGDPTVHHPWSLFRFWNHLFEDDVFAYNLSVLILLWAACFSQYCLLKKVAPNLSKTISVLLAVLIALGSLRYEFFFQRHWIALSIIIAPLSFILYDFIKRPLLRHYFLYTLTLFFALFLGSFVSLYQGLIFSVAFFVVLAIYKGLHKKQNELWISLKRFFLLNLASGLTIIFLGAWTFYSIFLEQNLVGYVRDPDYTRDGTFFVFKSLPLLIKELSTYFHAGIFSPWEGALTLNQTIPTHGWNMVVPIFPILLCFFIFYKSQNFWEFASKSVVFGFLIYQVLIAFSPGIINSIQNIIQVYPPVKFQPIIQVYEIVLIGIFLQYLQTQKKIISLRGQKAMQIAAILILPIYAGLLPIAFLAVLMPQGLESLLHFLLNWFSQFISFPSKVEAILPSLITGNVQIFNETMSAGNIIFYGLTFILIGIFSTPYFPKFLRLLNGHLFAIVLLINSFFLAWTVYPLNKESLIWDRQNKNEVKISETFKSTDRIALLGVPGCRKRLDFSVCVEKRILKGEFGPRRYIAGYPLGPSLEFSKIKSYTQKNVAEMMDVFMQKAGKYEKGYRRLMQGANMYGPLKLHDFSAVNYFYSNIRQPEYKHFELIHASQQFYLYKNLNAWPYFYLADRIKFIESYADLYEAEKGNAYFWKDSDAPTLSEKKHDSKGLIKLEKFEFGEMVFQTNSQEKEILVVTDAWHPHWRSHIDGSEAKVIKINGVFKGVQLPSGKHKVHFFIDNSSYLPGVWVTIVGWIIFLGAWFWTSKLESL